MVERNIRYCRTNRVFGSKLLVFLVCLIGYLTRAGEPQPPSASDMPVKQIGPTLFELGKVQFDKVQKTIVFPAAFNMTNGMIEYVLVTVNGKVHESLLRTEAQPYHIHLAMLLLGAKGLGTNSFPEDPAKAIPGEKVSMELSWKDWQGKDRTCPPEDLILNQQTREKATRGPWVYNGSRVLQGTFLAQQDGSIVSLMTDPDALLNNPRQGHENDKIWEIIPRDLPPVGRPVQVTLRITSPGKSE